MQHDSSLYVNIESLFTIIQILTWLAICRSDTVVQSPLLFSSLISVETAEKVFVVVMKKLFV